MVDFLCDQLVGGKYTIVPWMRHGISNLYTIPGCHLIKQPACQIFDDWPSGQVLGNVLLTLKILKMRKNPSNPPTEKGRKKN